MLIFIAVVWVLFGFSLLVPKSERFGRLSRPILERFEKAVPKETPKLLDVESLEPGVRGEEVKVMQEFLKEQGYFIGSPSPTYGPATKKAVQKFQKANGLEETGIADSETIKCINKVAYDLQKMRTE